MAVAHRRFRIPVPKRVILVDQIYHHQSGILRPGKSGIRVAVRQPCPDERFPVLSCARVALKRALGIPVRQVVATPETAAGVEVGDNINPLFFECGEQIVQTVEIFFVQRHRICGSGIDKPVVMVMKAHCIVTVARNLADNRICNFMRGEIHRIAEIGSEKTQPLLRSIPETERSIRRGNRRTVFSRRSVQQSRKIQRAARTRRIAELQREPLLSRDNLNRAFLSGKENFPFSKSHAENQPDHLAAVCMESHGNRIFSRWKRKSRTIHTKHTVRPHSRPCDCRIGQRARPHPVAAVPEPAYRKSLSGTVGKLNPDFPEFIRRGPRGCMKKIQCADRTFH